LLVATRLLAASRLFAASRVFAIARPRVAGRLPVAVRLRHDARFLGLIQIFVDPWEGLVRRDRASLLFEDFEFYRMRSGKSKPRPIAERSP
jgi:hypothetical protein